MRIPSRSLTRITLAGALLAGLVVPLAVAPAAMAADADPYTTCGGGLLGLADADASSGSINNSAMYSSLPCDLKLTTNGQVTDDVEANAVLRRYLQVIADVADSDRAYGKADLLTYAKQQIAAKKLLIADMSAAAFPFTTSDGKDMNYVVLSNMNTLINTVSSERLNRDRVTHIYKVLLYLQSWMKHGGQLAGLPKEVADIWGLVNSAYGVFEKAGQITSNNPAEWQRAGTNAATALAPLEIPDLNTVYVKALEFGTQVATVVLNDASYPTFLVRLGSAVNDPATYPTPWWGSLVIKPVVPKYNRWALTNNSFGPIHLMTPSTNATKFTTISYSAYLKRYAADRKKSRHAYFDRAYTQLFPGDKSIMVQFTADRDSRNFGKSKIDYTKASVDAITILSTGNAKKDKNLPVTNHGVGIGSTYAQVEKAYQMVPADSGFGWVYNLQKGKPVGKNKDKTATSIYESDTYQVGNLGNEISFRFHGGKVVGVRIASNFGAYDDVPWDATQAKQKLLK